MSASGHAKAGMLSATVRALRARVADYDPDLHAVVDQEGTNRNRGKTSTLVNPDRRFVVPAGSTAYVKFFSGRVI